MNYQPNPAMRNPQGLGRKMKRVSDVNVMGPSAPLASGPAPYMQPTLGPAIVDPMMTAGPFGGVVPQSGHIPPAGSMNVMGAAGAGNFNNGGVPMPQGQNYGYAGPQASNAPHSQAQYGVGPATAGGMGGVGAAAGSGMPAMGGPNQYGGAGVGAQFPMFQQPIVQDMAMQYGQRLADQGKQLVENQFEKWIPVAKLKYYFAVDNKYVINKMRLLFFPFTHKDWSLKYDQENPVQPRYDINAPDLYIPTMAYITYVVVAGLMLGMQSRFSPEQLGIQASSALAYSIFELVVYSITLYVVNIKTNLKTLDLLAFAGYKFVIIVACLLISTMFHGVGYYAMLAYSSLTLGFFLLRTLKTKVLNESTPAATTGAIHYDPYGNPQQLDYSGGRKRKLYFLFLIVGGQAFLSFLLSKHLYLPDAATLAVRNQQF